MQSGSQVYQIIPSTQEPPKLVTSLPVETPVSIPLEPLFYINAIKTSVDYRIDELDGQSVKRMYG